MYFPTIRLLETELRFLNSIPLQTWQFIEPRLIIKPDKLLENKDREKIEDKINQFFGGLSIIPRSGPPFIIDSEPHKWTYESAKAFLSFSTKLKFGKHRVLPVFDTNMLPIVGTSSFVNICKTSGKIGFRYHLDANRHDYFSDTVLACSRTSAPVVYIVDVGDISQSKQREYARAKSSAIIEWIRSVSRSSEIILHGAAFPKSLGKEMGEKRLMRFPRHELALFKELAAKAGPHFHFGDFGAKNPSFGEHAPPPKLHRGTIRYTSEANYLVARGDPNPNVNRAQYSELSRAILTSEEFRGESFGRAEREICKVADGRQEAKAPRFWSGLSLLQHLQITEMVLRDYSYAEGWESIAI